MEDFTVKNKGRKTSLRKILAIVLAFMMVFGLMPITGMSTEAWAAEDETTPPTASKTLTDNHDGTYTITLSVTGKSESSTTKSGANILVVLDTSGSMAFNAEGQEEPYNPANRRIYQAKQAVNTLAGTLYGQASENITINMALETFDTTAHGVNDWTTNLNTFRGYVNAISNSPTGGTNWEDALQDANDVTAPNSYPTYVIFVTDGNPTFHITDGGYNDWNRQYNVYGTGQEGQQNVSNCYNSAIDDAKDIVDGGKTLYTLGIYGSIDRMEGLTNYAYTGSETGTPGAKYYYAASDQTAMNKAFANIASSITNTLGYEDVTLEDGVTDLSTSAAEFWGVADPNSFTYTKGGSDWAEAPAAKYEDGKVSWSPVGEHEKLENGVTYTVSFKVWPSQEAYDLVADLNNGVKNYDSLPEDQQEQIVKIGDSYSLKTNVDDSAKINYTQVETTTSSSGQTSETRTPGSATLTNPDPVGLTGTQMSVTKEWNASLDPSQADEVISVELDIMYDKEGDGIANDVYQHIVLAKNSDGSWPTVSKAIAPGLRTTADGVLETGHVYSLVETAVNTADGTSVHFELETETLHPMLVDGTMSWGGADNNSTLKATNNLKGGVSITKAVEAPGLTPDPDAEFTFTIALSDYSDTDVAYRIYHADGTRTPKIAITAATNVAIKAGETIRIQDVPAGITYTITEQTTGMADGFEFDKAEVTTAPAGAETAVNNNVFTGKIVANTSAAATFTNKYSTEPITASFPVTKELVVPEGLEGPEDASWTVTLTAGEGVPMPTTTTGTIAEGTDATFGPITYNAPGEYTYTVTESGEVDGVTNDPTSAKTVKVTVEDDGKGGLTATVKGADGTDEEPSENTTFTNTYNVKPVKVDPPVQKIIENKDDLYNKGDFTFTIEATSPTDAPMPGNTSIKNNATYELTDKKGYYEFGEITFTAPGTYTYKITESGSVAGVTNDTAAATGKTITFTVTDDREGNLEVDPTTDQVELSFTNTYDANGEATLEVTKALKGAEWPEGKTLTLTLEGASGAPMPEEGKEVVELTEAGKATFGPIEYKLEDAGKTYEYTITEDGFGDGWTGSPESITATVEVTDKGDGTLDTKVTYDPEDKTITNKYEASGEATIEVTKALSGAAWPEGKTLTLTLTGTGNAPMPEEDTVVELTAAGKATFGTIAYTEADAGKTYTYTITEDGFGAGWTGAPESVTATVKVTDNGDGKLKTEVTYSPEDATITNTYKASGEATIEVTKAIEGAAWPSGKTLTMTLEGANGAPMPKEGKEVVELTAAGKATFGKIAYSEADIGKTYTYTITEDGFGDGWTGEPESITATVAVEDNGDGTLKTTVTYDPEDATITNKYEASGEATIEVTKALSGAAWPEGKKLTLTLAGTNSAPMPKEDTVVELTAAGKATFGTIAYTEADAGKTYTYTITEDGFGAGWTGAPESVTATVKVTDNGDGKLKTEVTYNPTDATITNTYKASGEATIEVTKAIEGAPWPSGKTLTLTLAGTDAPMPAKTTATLTSAGKASFGKIAYTEADIGKTYTYTITEDGFGAGWTGEPTSVTATVKVTDNGDGTLKTEVTYSPEDATITNKYEASGEATIEVTKALSGAAWPEGKTLTLTLAGDGPMPETKTATLTAAGKAAFEKIAYTEADIGKTYEYTITEDGFGDGWTGSPETITATVKVTDNGNGTLKTEVTYDPTDKTITNTYKAEGEATIEVTKALEGAEWPEGKKLTFTLAGTGNAPMPEEDTEVELTAAGTATFGTIKYTEKDAGKTYTYTVTEDGFGRGWTADPTSVTATVEVTDNGDGTLDAAVTYDPEAATITNIYKAEGKTSIPVKKIINPGDFDGPTEWEFTMTLSGGGPLPEETKKTVNNSNPTATFGDINYTEKDAGKTYTYTISESGEVAGVSLVGDKTVEVTVTDNGDGTLSIKAVEKDGTSEKEIKAGTPVEFENPYECEPVEIEIPVRKTITKTNAPRGEVTFKFELTGSDPLPDTTTLEISLEGSEKGSKDGSFADVEFTKPGTYTYTISETELPKGWSADGDKSGTVTITVTDNGKGALEASITDTVEIKNQYQRRDYVPKTDDNTNLDKWGIGAAISVAGFAGVELIDAIVKKRRKEEDEAK